MENADPDNKKCFPPPEEYNTTTEGTSTTLIPPPEAPAEGEGVQPGEDGPLPGDGLVITTTETTSEGPSTTPPPKPKFVPFILCSINWCHGYGSLVVIFVIFHILWIYYVLFKPYVGRKLYNDHIDGMIDKWIEFRSKL